MLASVLEITEPASSRPQQTPEQSAVISKWICGNFKSFFVWCQRRYDLLDALNRVPDGRSPGRVRISLPAILLALLCMFWLGLGSIRALEDRLDHSPRLRRVLAAAGWSEGISDDTFADALNALGFEVLREFLYFIAKRELKRWRAGRYKESELGKRLFHMLGPTGTAFVSRIPVAIDGHELFASRNRRCEECSTRQITIKKKGKETTIEERFHRVVVAHWIGSHPGIVLDFEPVNPGEGELPAAYRLIKRLAKVYGQEIGTLVGDAAYDGNPFRSLALKSNYHFVVRHKNGNIDPGRSAKKEIDKYDPNRTCPKREYRDYDRKQTYACWEHTGPLDGWRYVEARRTRTLKKGTVEVQTGACITDYTPKEVPAVAIALLMETRWWIENTAFHELAGQWSLDRAFVHSGRPQAVVAIVALALLAYNALQAYLYRELGINPSRPERTLGDIRRDFWETLALFTLKGLAHARAP